jgi:hypothetical protein
MKDILSGQAFVDFLTTIQPTQIQNFKSLLYGKPASAAQN